MVMERKAKRHGMSAPSLLGEVFAATNGKSGRTAKSKAQAVQKLHARLHSSKFAARMTGIFFEAKRAAITGSK